MSATAAPNAPPSRLYSALWALVLIALVAGGIFAAFSSVHYRWNWESFWKNRGIFFEGWLLTLGISTATMVLSTLGGLVLMAGGRSHWVPVQATCTTYITLMRGTPLIVVILLGYYGVVAPLNLEAAIPAAVGNVSAPAAAYLRENINWAVFAGIGLLSAFEAAYLAEIFRGALESIGRSQRESARAVGFNIAQTYRYVLVPQSIRRALPGMAGELVSLVKSTSLLSVIAIEEVTQVTRLINSRSYTSLEGFIPLAIAYLVITLPLTWVANSLERRFAYET